MYPVMHYWRAAQQCMTSSASSAVSSSGAARTVGIHGTCWTCSTLLLDHFGAVPAELGANQKGCNMSLAVAIIAAGEMGSAMARELKPQGVRVLTCLVGRSPVTIERAQAAGFEALPDDEALIGEADLVLSVVPPNSAIALAERLAPALARAKRKPVYVDCNAVAPKTVVQVADILASGGSPFVDAAIFGGPTSGKPGTVLYVSGAHALKVMPLSGLGLSVRVLEGPIGAASALKLSFAGINKGFTALGAAMVLTATRTGSARGLLEQLAETQPAILAYIARFVPAMFPKARRWEPEMREIAAFLEDDPPLHDIFNAMARIYHAIAAQVASDGQGDIDSLRRFCTEAADIAAKRAAER
jgi:L-threonate 2-dehydrogenase